jgi:TATA-box binding protein (TBP) (component of TFIID and TFIIIB)
LRISTMTITCNLNTLISIENIGKYIDLNFGSIVCIKYGNNKIRTLIKLKKVNKKSKKKKKNFYNQASIVVDVKNKKRVNIKVFKNGAIQMTGCKNIENFIDAMTVLCSELTKRKAIYDKTECKIIKKEFVTNPENVNVSDIYNFKIRMINSNFHIGFLINRENLYELLSKDGIRCSFEPCIHACVNIKYNYKNKDTISIFVFESGSIVITGAKSKSHIVEAYKFITKVLYENYDNIVKNDIDKFLEKPEIKELINQSLTNDNQCITDKQQDHEFKFGNIICA